MGEGFHFKRQWFCSESNVHQKIIDWFVLSLAFGLFVLCLQLLFVLCLQLLFCLCCVSNFCFVCAVSPAFGIFVLFPALGLCCLQHLTVWAVAFGLFELCLWLLACLCCVQLLCWLWWDICFMRPDDEYWTSILSQLQLSVKCLHTVAVAWYWHCVLQWRL